MSLHSREDILKYHAQHHLQNTLIEIMKHSLKTNLPLIESIIHNPSRVTLEDISQLAMMIAHEPRNPINEADIVFININEAKYRHNREELRHIFR